MHLIKDETILFKCDGENIFPRKQTMPDFWKDDQPEWIC